MVPIESRMSRHILLDWSGTVVDDLPPVLAATNKIFEDFGRPPLTLEQFRREFRLPFSGFYAEHLPEATMEGLEVLYRRFFEGLQDAVTLLPGALEFLEFCRATGRRVFLLSTIQPDHWHTQAGRLGVREFFEHAYVGVMDKREKIREILSDHGLDPRETLFAGDMVHDIETARHGGVLSVAVLSGFDPLEKLIPSKPDVILPGLGELRRLLEGSPVPGPARPVATVGALLFDDAGRVLMLRTHKWSGLWGIPGGKVRRGEPCEAALRREVLEETGLELEDIAFVLLQEAIDSPEFERPEHFLLANYTARARPGRVRLNEEAEEARWVTPAEARDLPLNGPTRILLRHVLAQGQPR
jgi:phosphoglycolate phosphatase